VRSRASRHYLVIAFLNGLETSWLLNPSLPVEDVAAAWRDSQLAQMTVNPRKGAAGS
jgi:hypothetical protein